MSRKIPSIAVRIICFNQEELVQRAIDSVISQREYVDVIYILDDCSTDNTWQNILEYKSRYPDLIKPVRNTVNLGIMKNVEKRWKFPSGDLNYDLSGDDEVGKGWFKKVIKAVEENQIDYENEAVSIYGDAACIYPNGDIYTFQNKAIETGVSPLKLYERGMIYSMSVCYSKKVLLNFKDVSDGRSLVAENAQDAQLHIFSDKRYYIPHIGNIYYTNTGVSKDMSAEAFKDYESTMIYAFKFFNSLGINIDKYDTKLPEYNIACKKFMKEKNFKTLIGVIKSYIRSYDPQIGFRDINTKKIIFSILRKLPHKKPLKW